RNYFDGNRYAVVCRDGLVDAAGHPVHVRAELSTANRLEATVEVCDAVGACKPDGKFTHGDVGVVFAFADLDHDGKPEVVYAAAGAPGDPDSVRIVELFDEKKPKLVKKFQAGGVAGIAVTDLDGDGIDDVVVAVRLVGSTRVDLWRLE